MTSKWPIDINHMYVVYPVCDVFIIRTRLHDAPVFEQIKPTCEKYKQNVFYSGAVSWNTLPSQTRNIETYEEFKFQQKRWALSQLRN